MQGKISKDYIYLYLSRNSNDVFNRIHGIRTLETTKNQSNLDTTADDSRNDLNWSMGETDCVLPALRKTISLSKSEWDTLKSHIADYKHREYEVLVIGWTDAVYDILWSHLKLPCPYSFKNAKINRNSGEIFLSIRGSCGECNSKIHIYCQSEPTEDGVILHVSTFDSRGIVHVKKRQVQGDRRVRIGKELQGKSTYAWRRDETNKLMDFGDVVPANLPSENVIRKAKQESRDKDLGLFKVKAALASVWDLKYSQEFNGSIHEIGLDKFYVMYWTPTQIFLYKKYHKEADISSISIDATGSLFKQIPKPDGSKRTVYLYQAVCGYRGKILPLFQMISEKHDTNTLTYWMREWLRSGASCPEEVIIDYSLALLNATSLAFNNCDLKTYIENCIIFESSSSSLRVQHPRCYIRIDIANLIKLVSRWSCFDYESPEKKDFHLRCIGLLSACTQIDDFIQVCTDVLAVAFSTHEDIDDEESHCFAATKRLFHRLKSNNLPNDAPGNLEDREPALLERFDDYDNEVDLQSSAINAILEKIETGSTNNLKCGRLNPYHCANFGPRLLKLSKQFVLCTAVMTGDDYHNSTLVEFEDVRVASSARSEKYFGILKNGVYKKGMAIRMDKGLVIHLRSLEGTSKLLNEPEPQTKKVVSKIVHSTPEKLATLKNSSLVEIENSTSYNLSVTKFREGKGDKITESKNLVSPNYNTEKFAADLSKVSPLSGHTTVDSFAPEMTYLNEIENWRGLNEKSSPIKPKVPGKVKKRGKYLTACPDIEIVHKRPKFIEKLPLLMNGNKLGPVKIGRHMVKIQNTCAFDSTAQSLLAAYHDFVPYYEYLTDNNNDLFQFIRKLSTTGMAPKLYQERGCILSTTKDVESGLLNCEINISYLQEKFILRDVPSLEKTIRCDECAFENSKIIPVLHLNPIPIYRYGLAGLQSAVNETLHSRSTSTCFRCKSTKITKGLSEGMHLMLDIEDVGCALLSSRHNSPDCRKHFTVKEIPENLVYGEYTYKFVSAIIFIDSHYFAVIKRATGKWELHNDLSSRVMDVTPRTLLTKHSIHVLFYVRLAKTND